MSSVQEHLTACACPACIVQSTPWGGNVAPQGLPANTAFAGQPSFNYLESDTSNVVVSGSSSVGAGLVQQYTTSTVHHNSGSVDANTTISAPAAPVPPYLMFPRPSFPPTVPLGRPQDPRPPWSYPSERGSFQVPTTFIEQSHVYAREDGVMGCVVVLHIRYRFA